MKIATLKIYENRRQVGERQVTDEQIRIAFNQYDTEYPLNDYPRTNKKPDIKTWLTNQKYDYAIKYKRKCYPPKYILSLAVEPKLQGDEYFYGGGENGNANQVIQELGFEIIAKADC